MAESWEWRPYLRRAGAIGLTTLFGVVVYGETHHMAHSGDCSVLRGSITCDGAQPIDHGLEST